MAEAQNILLTGTGTGVGRALLFALVRKSLHRIAILMRESGEYPAAQRAARLFDGLGFTRDERARLEVLPGTLTSDGFGLRTAQQARLAETLDLIIHTAEEPSLTAERALSEVVNRTGTANALLFAGQCFGSGPLRRFIHLSTAFVAGSGSRGIIREDELPTAPVHLNNYEWSKYEGERIVRAAMQAGLPATVFRPGIMIRSEAADGKTYGGDVILPLLRLIANRWITSLPINGQARVAVAPVDFVVEAITRALDAEWTTGLTFHLILPQPPTVADLFNLDGAFTDAAQHPQLCAAEDFDASLCSAHERELLETVGCYLPYFNSRLTFEMRNTARLVGSSVRDANYLNRLRSYLAAALASDSIRQAAA